MSNKMIPILALSAAVAAAPAVLAQTAQTQEQKKKVGTTGAVAAAEVEDIVDDPEEYYGERVTVSGDVNEVFGPRMFNIREEGVVDVDDTLLVIHPQKQRGQAGTAGTTGVTAEVKVTENSTVQVTGTVRKFVRRDLEREYGIDFADWGITDDNWFNTYNERPVLIADRLDVRR